MEEIVIIGGGHNGLVTAFYLARAGLKPLVLERRPVVGGSAVTEEFHPGFRCSTLLHSAGPLLPEVLRDMQLERHGLRMIQADPRLFAPAPDGRALLFYGDPARTAHEIARYSAGDAEKYPEFHAALARLGPILAQLARMTPPDIDSPSSGDLWNLLKTFKRFRGLSREDRFRLLRWPPTAVADFAGEWFETELLRAAVAARGIFGTFAGPWSAGTTGVLLWRAMSDAHPVGASCFARGGMGALTEAMAAAATAAGARIRTSAEVESVTVKGGVATGVVLAGGEEIPAKSVVSNADPRRTFLRLVDLAHLPPSFVGKMRNYLCRGVTAKVNLALSALPSFTALKSLDVSETEALGGRIHIGPEIDYLERAFDAAKYGRLPQNPYLDVTIPSISDDSLAPNGKHVMSVHVQFAPRELRESDWKRQRDALGDTVLATLAEYAPGLPGLVLARQVLTPEDIEETFGLTGGDIFHGEPALDQLFTMRPLLGWARYRTPLRGLYLCGSGTHPGNGLTGASGANAAREILNDLRRQPR